MSGIGKLMLRLGYVKLDRYGLLVTPEDRIMATRPTILDDGVGGRIVGWRDGDLAAMELSSWAPIPQITRPATTRHAPPPLPVAKPAVTATPVATARPLPGLVAYVPPMPVVPVIPPVAATPIKAAPVVEADLTEDEWEWEIAVARARAAAEEVELAARVIPIAQARKPVPAKKFVSKPKTLPGIAPFIDDAAVTEVGDDTQVTAVRAPAQARASSPRTIIPVPKLPSMASAARSIGSASWIPQPVVRKTGPMPVVPRRMAKGTMPVSGDTTSVNSEQTSPMIQLREETVPNLPTPLPSIKQRMANRG